MCYWLNLSFTYAINIAPKNNARYIEHINIKKSLSEIVFMIICV